MFVTCHINFWPLSNFVGASLEVTRTVRNNKLHFSWLCSFFWPWDRIPFFFLMMLTFFKNILILIITSVAPHYSQNVSRGFSILVCIGVQVFFRGFIFRSSSGAWLALALASVWPKNTEKLRLFCRSGPPQWN